MMLHRLVIEEKPKTAGDMISSTSFVVAVQQSREVKTAGGDER
jgi:hypothetical protein